MMLPYFQQLELMPVEDTLRTALETLRSAPPPQARSIFAQARKTDDLREITARANGWKTLADTLVVVGSGGSGLSGKALALLHNNQLERDGKKLIVLDTLDDVTFTALCARLDYTRTAFLFISKSGGTAETCAQALCLLDAASRAGITDFSARMCAISCEDKSALRTLCAQYTIPVLTHEADLCGRFSILSIAGLLPAAFMGVDIAALRRGAGISLEHHLQPSSPALQSAAWHVAQLRAGKSISAFMAYSEQLSGLGLWWRQSWAESLGKNGSGTTPAFYLGTADQHSQLQLFLGGPEDKSYTLCFTDCAQKGGRIPHTTIPGMEALSGRTLGDLLSAQGRATHETLKNHGRPVRVFRIARADEETMGALIMHLTLEILLVSASLGINPYDQPAVEESKRLAHVYLTQTP